MNQKQVQNNTVKNDDSIIKVNFNKLTKLANEMANGMGIPNVKITVPKQKSCVRSKRDIDDDSSDQE